MYNDMYICTMSVHRDFQWDKLPCL